MNGATLTQVESAADQFQTTVLDIVNDLLDTHYETYPDSNAYGVEYDAPAGTTDGIWYLGREHGADGADDETGVDFIYRRFEERDDRGRRQREYEYLYGKYGWPSASQILDEAPLFRQVLEEAVEDNEYLDEAVLDQYDAAVETVEDALYETRHSLSLDDLADLIQDYDIDTLRTLFPSDDDTQQVLWQLLHSKDEDDETIQNRLEIPVVREDVGLMFVRAERYFHDPHREPDGKWYAFGCVVGFDDTDERFFIHRLESDPDLRDPDFEWTLGAIKEKMGFDIYYDDLATEDIPFDMTVLLQGDVAFVRRDLRTALSEYYDDRFETLRSNAVRDHMQDFREEHSELVNHSALYMSRHRPEVRVNNAPKTEDLKELQDDLDIAEDDVRDEQEQRGINRLTAKRRRNIIEDMLEARIYEWVYETTDISESDLEEEADAQAHEAFTDVDNQVNLVLGNHTLILGPAREHPDNQYGDEETLASVVVPGEGQGFVWHDEHENKKVTLPQGVYEFRFLQGHETQFWMN